MASLVAEKNGQVDPISSCLNIMRRLPPANIEQNLSGLLNLVPSITDELLQRVDQPLEISTCGKTKKQFLFSDYNRDGDSYRSPWGNEYHPALDDGFKPSDKLRQLEVQANDIFESYRELYYEGGVSSVYLWDLEEETQEGFAGCFLIKKDVAGAKHVKQGSWNSIHVVECNVLPGGKAIYKLTTTIMIAMDTNGKESGVTNLAGSLTRQSEQTTTVTEEKSHLVNIGHLIEDMENEMRNNMEGLYIQKTKEIVDNIRNVQGGPTQGNEHTGKLNAAVLKHGDGRKIDSEI